MTQPQDRPAEQRRWQLKAHAILFFLIPGLVTAERPAGPDRAQLRIVDSWEIDEVPSGFPVDFSLLTGKRHQYIAYYNAERQMTVASRLLGTDKWHYQALPSKVGWDSHNYITMALDGDGHLHLSGNMHGVKLIYFRTREAGDISSLERREMTGEREDRVTYPQFLTDHEGALVFAYRNGSSGNGMRIWNKYDTATKSWSRLLDTPLLDGEGKRNAYPLGPIRGPDGWFHLVWVWRDTPDCATNHHLSHARSKDLINWESAFGRKVALPITIDEKSLWVDPIPPGGGIINGGERLFFDAELRPVITYHKSDRNGHMQVYAARPEGATWKRHALTDWRKRVEFSGHGSMGFVGIRISGLSRAEPDLLTMTYRHRDYGRGRLFIDEDSLRPTKRRARIAPTYPREMARVQSDFEGMGIRRSADLGGSASDRVRYVLQWETLDANHDRPRKPPLPEPSTLWLHKLTANEGPETGAGQDPYTNE